MEPQKMNYHRSIPSLSSSIASSEPRTSSSSSTSINNNYYLYQNFNTSLNYSNSLKCNKVIITPIEQKRFSEPLKRWDDSQLEMELAEDDLIMDKKKKVRRNSSLRLIDKFRHHHQHRQQDQVKKNSFKSSLKKVYDWLF